MAGPAAKPAGLHVDVPPVEPPATPDKRGVSQLAIGFVVALILMVIVGILAELIRDQEAIWLDSVANPFLHAISSPTLDFVMNAITTIGSAQGLGPVLIVVCAILLYRGYRVETLFLLVAIGGSVALNGAMKLVIARPRPVLPWAHVLPDYSFPSGHTMNSLVLYLAIAILIWGWRGRRAGSIAVTVALLITLAVGFSRIYLGYHYLSDVVGGLAAGLAWLFVVAIGFETIPRTWARRPWARRSVPASPSVPAPPSGPPAP